MVILAKQCSIDSFGDRETLCFCSNWGTRRWMMGIRGNIWGCESQEKSKNMKKNQKLYN
jgi:hypothetical protein